MGQPFPLVQTLASLAVLALAVAGLMIFPRHNVKALSNGNDRRLITKYKISMKKPVIDLTKQGGDLFRLKVEKSTSQKMNGAVIEVRRGPATLLFKITYAGKPFLVEADFREGTINEIK